MDAATRAEEFSQLQRDICEARSESAADARLREELEYASTFHKFELLDEVFGAFFATNIHQGKRFTLEDLLNIQHGKTFYFQFTHLEVPYLATVFRLAGAHNDWINIKLCNDGFLYIPKNGRTMHRHNVDGWVRLNADRYQPYMARMVSTVRSLYGEVVSYYNSMHQRFDMKFFPRQPEDAPNMNITFEPGYPDEDQLQPRDSI